MWGPTGITKRTIKPIDPIALVTSSQRLMKYKKEFPPKNLKPKPFSNIRGHDEIKHLTVPNKTFLVNELVKAIDTDDYISRMRALRELPEILENPTSIAVAIDLKIVPKLISLQQRMEKQLVSPRNHEDALMYNLFLVLSKHPTSARQMANSNSLVTVLYSMIQRMRPHQHIAAAILRNLSGQREVLQVLTKNSRIFKMIKTIMQRELCTTYYPKDLWVHLRHLLEMHPEKGLKENLMDTFLYRIKIKLPDFHLDNMKCLATLLQTAAGRTEFQAQGGLDVIRSVFCQKSFKLSTYKHALDIINRMIESPSMMEDCSKCDDLAEGLVNFTKTTISKDEQTLAYEILDKLKAHPCFKHYLKNLKKTIHTTKTFSKESEFLKFDIMCTLNGHELRD